MKFNPAGLLQKIGNNLICNSDGSIIYATVSAWQNVSLQKTLVLNWTEIRTEWKTEMDIIKYLAVQMDKQSLLTEGK